MEALTNPAPPLLNLPCSNKGHRRPLIHLLRYPNSIKINVGFYNSISLRIFKIKSSEEPPIFEEEDVVDVVDSVATVHVRFELQKECIFGEQILLVGEDPILGLWDPSNAIPLDWSDEHVWRVDLDLPIGNYIFYKFILKAATEELFWQPGPDRMLETWETNNIIVVSEDWENVEARNIIEELSEENSSRNGRKTSDDEEEAINTLHLKEESVKPKEDTFVEENVLGKNGSIATANVQDDNLVVCVGEPVLVPGLTPYTEEVCSPITKTNTVSDASTGTGEAEEAGMLELCEPKDDQYDNGLEYEATLQNALPNDSTWGRKTLHKLLTSLGLTFDETWLNGQ